jgi:LysR family transcriptional regulator, low CO2-responsive transcriptional regulator
MGLPLDQVKTFLAVVRTGSFAGAADQLAVTPSAVSQQIQRLEVECGTKLFDRIGRGVRLSPAGEMLQPYAERIESLAGDAQRALEYARDLKTGSLRVISSSTAAAYLLPGLWAAFKQRHPGIFLHISVDNSARVIERLVRFQDDIGVLGAEHEHPDLIFHPLAEDPLVAVVPAAHSWSQRSSIELADLADEPLILREPGSASRQLLESALTAAGIKYQPSMEIASHEVAKRLVELGCGVAVMSAAIAAREVEQGRLRQIRIRDTSLRLKLYLAHHRERAGTPVIDAMLELARS